LDLPGPDPGRAGRREERQRARCDRTLHRRLHRPRERSALAAERLRLRRRRHPDGSGDPRGRQQPQIVDPAPAAIRTEELGKRYGKITALAGLTMSIPAGDVFGFLGPNGAGKTTAVKLLLGLARPTSG